MSDASTLGTMSPGLLKVVERARREPEGRFHSLAHRIDEPALRRAYDRMRKDAAVGVDGMTKERYGQDLEQRLQDLHERLRSKSYRHQPILRVHIPKGQGKTRPIGISAFEDKLVQDAVREVLEAIYEQDFLDCSYGFRPRRSTHDAVRTLNRIVHRGEVSWILEADIVSFFFNYFGVNGNFRSLQLLVEATKRAWFKWLCRRSQRKRLTWERFADLLRDMPLPRPRITVSVWG